jgi:hypothetical protein
MSSFKPYSAGIGSVDWTQAFERAEEYLGAKSNRPLQNNTRLVRVTTDAISVVLHNTSVVTYHRSGEFTIYGGGWNSVTTKARIREWSPIRSLYSVDGAWVVGHTGETTAPRVQKCRTCKGRARWMETDYCYGKRYVWDGPTNQGYQPCEHGQTERHATGESERACYRCNATGTVDYGSKPVPITVTASQAFTVDTEGTYLGLADPVHAPMNGYPPSAKYSHSSGYYGHSFPYNPPASSSTPDTYGAELVDSLAEILPNVRAMVRHPVTTSPVTLERAIVSLNDSHGWTRERIAEWLETLDLDLRFPVSTD